MNIRSFLVDKINSSLWWHVVPKDKDAYKKRGKFLAPTFTQAEFYGRPNDNPEKVCISNPLYGFSEMEIIKKLFSNKIVLEHKKYIVELDNDEDKNWYEERIYWDARIYKKAKIMGYDSIVLLCPNARKYFKNNRKPHSIELNLLNT